MSVPDNTSARTWDWDEDGVLDGLYVATREVTIRNGPSAGQSKLIFDLHWGVDDEPVAVFETAVLRSKFRNELQRRHKPDFEPGERITITPLGLRDGVNGSYRDFDVVFEHAAPPRSTAELLGVTADADGDDDQAGS